jgi:phenylacetate-coenzyme A ligase PaaK-like adenylate-forming protein
MSTRSKLRDKIFKVNTQSFSTVVHEVFNYQYENNESYHQYCSLLNADPSKVYGIEQVPFLPIEIFKTHRVICKELHVEKIFASSGTTSSQTSRHLVADLKLYEESFLRCFHKYFGDSSNYCILALLPSYLERSDSSLAYMAGKLIEKSRHPRSGSYLKNHEELHSVLLELEGQQQRTLLLGVTFALLDFTEKFPIELNHTIVMETGGMKGRRKEQTRQAIHEILKKQLSVNTVHSEYGMTELLSQAYYLEDGRFHCPPWMRVLIRDVNDPLQILGLNMTGAINVIDLANLDSCSFIATGDLGRSFSKNTFDVLGRMDETDIRGCNMMWE